MEITKKDFKSYLNTLFLCLLLLLVSFTVELEFNGASVPLSITDLVAAIILIARSSKLKHVSKEFNAIYLTAIAIVAAIILNPLLQILITTVSFQSAFIQLTTQLNLLSNAGNLTTEHINVIIESFVQLSDYAVLVGIIEAILSFAPVAYLYFAISKLIKAYCEINNVDDVYLLAKQTKKTAIYHIIPSILSIIFVWSLFYFISNVKIVDDGTILFDNGFEFGTFLLIIVSIATLVFFIVDLVQIIKCLIRINKFSKDPVLND